MNEERSSQDWAVGKISYIEHGKIRVRCSHSDLQDRIMLGSAERFDSLNQFLFSYIDSHLKIVFRVVAIETLEKPYDSSELSRYKSELVITAIPAGQIENGKYRPGVISIPMVGSIAYACQLSDLALIFRAEGGDEVGHLLGEPRVRPLVDLDKLFSRHLVVLGNSGSGKSTSMRLLLSRLIAHMDAGKVPPLNPGALIVVLDIHGDYAKLATGVLGAKVQYVGGSGYHMVPGDLTLEDWNAVLDPSKKIQKPLLERAVKYSHLNDDGKNKLYAAFAFEAVTDTSVDSHAARKFQIRKYYEKISDKLVLPKAPKFHGASTHCSDANAYLREFNLNYGNIPAGLTDDILGMLGAFIGSSYMRGTAPSVQAILEDEKLKKSPNDVTVGDVVDALDFVFSEEEVRGNRQARSYSEGLTTQLRNLREKYSKTLFSVSRGKAIQDLIEDPGVLILDTSGITDEDGLKILSNYLARKLFDRNVSAPHAIDQPVYLVFDEAHRYIRENALTDDSIFNRIAREGRKFGVMLAVISQIPHELSSVVLSQAGAFLLHRTQNATDLDYLRRNVSSATFEQISRLSSFAPGCAILLGSSIEIPVELQVDGDYKDETRGATIWDV